MSDFCCILKWIVGLPVVLVASICSLITNNKKYRKYFNWFCLSVFGICLVLSINLIKTNGFNLHTIICLIILILTVAMFVITRYTKKFSTDDKPL